MSVEKIVADFETCKEAAEVDSSGRVVIDNASSPLCRCELCIGNSTRHAGIVFFPGRCPRLPPVWRCVLDNPYDKTVRHRAAPGFRLSPE